MPVVVPSKLMTVDEFWAQYAGKPYELVNGEVVERMPAGMKHGAIARRILKYLGDFVDEHELGEVYASETGFYLAENTMRAADAAFVKAVKLVQVEEADKFAPFAPNIAVEVISPSETATAIQQKVDQYLQAGTQLVWVVYPELSKVTIHRPDGHSQSLVAGETLTGENVLPGFEVDVSALFPPDK